MRFISAVALAASLATPFALSYAAAAELPRRPANPGAASLAFAAPEWHRPLPLSPENARLVGEAVSHEFPVFVTAGEVARPAKLRLGYLNAISVMPETFKLTVKVNDTVIGDTVVQNSNQPEALTLNVPPGLLEPGFNAVRVSVRQTHRVDCSPASTYELWTQLMPEQSELVFSGLPGEIRDVRDLPAVKPGKDGATRIRVRSTDERRKDGIDRVSRAVQSAVLLGRYANPVVELDPEQPSEAGLDIVVGTASTVEGMLGFRVAGSGPRHQLIQSPQDGRVILIVTGATEAEVDAALDGLAERVASAPPQGSAAGLRALRNMSGRQVAGGETVTLAELGLDPEPFRGRLNRQTFRLQLPADFLAADYGRVTLAADAIYAADLSPGAKLIVRVNGAPIVDVPMASAGGEVLNKRHLYLPVASFKPGLNTIDIEAETPTGGDAKCDLAALTDQRERFILSGSSEITVPALARVGTLPNISSILSGGLTQLSAQEVQVFVPKGRLLALDASLTMLAKMASISQRETRAAFTFDRLAEGTRHVLAIGAFADMPEATLRAANLDPGQLRQAWQKSAPETPRISLAEQRAQSGPTPGAPVQVAFMGDQAELLQAARLSQPANAESAPSAPAAPPGSLASQADASWFGGRVQGLPARLLDMAAEPMVRAGLIRSRESRDLVLNDRTTLVVAQGAKTKDLEADWRARLVPSVGSTTVVVAATADQLVAGTAELLSGSLWEQFVGQSAAYNAHDGVVATRVSGETWLVPTAPLDLQNLRLIAAGWLSRNVPVHLAALLGILVVLTLSLHRVLRMSGVREP